MIIDLDDYERHLATIYFFIFCDVCGDKLDIDKEVFDEIDGIMDQLYIDNLIGNKKKC